MNHYRFNKDFTKMNKRKNTNGFSIIELVVVIVVIGIIATMTFVYYNGVQSKAHDVSVLSDIDAMASLQTSYGLKNKVAGKSYYSGNGYDIDLGFKVSEGNVIDVVINDNDYCIRGYNLNSSKKSINDAYIKESSDGICSQLPPSTSYWLTIGTQTWAKTNLNVGVMLDSDATNPTNNGTVEKWCFNNSTANCTSYGGLYQWDEMMNYSTIPYGQTGWVQDICPVGSHVPTDTEWKTLEMHLGMTQAEADATDWRGTDQGTKLRSGNPPGLYIPLAGYRGVFGSFNNLLSLAGLWSSSESDVFNDQAWDRFLSSDATVRRATLDKRNGLSVRCIRNQNL